MTDVVIVAATRTAIGSFGGSLAGLSAVDLGAAVISSLIKKTSVDAGLVDEVLMGQVLTAGAGMNPARQSAIAAGIPDGATAWTLEVRVSSTGAQELYRRFGFAPALAAEALAFGLEGGFVVGGEEDGDGAGLGRDVTLFNCFVAGGLVDSLEGILESLKDTAITMQHGGGIGLDFSPLRPRGSPAVRTGATASGPVSFMRVWDSMCETLLATGRRRGAMMGTLRCDHPDIEAFVTAKTDPARLRLYIGYAGWAPGQLDYELARGSWRVVPATDELVFAEAPRELWKQLAPAHEQRGIVGNLVAAFLDMVGVVQAEANDGSGFGHGQGRCDRGKGNARGSGRFFRQ